MEKIKIDLLEKLSFYRNKDPANARNLNFLEAIQVVFQNNENITAQNLLAHASIFSINLEAAIAFIIENERNQILNASLF